MNFEDYQQWFAMEEVGEIAREILYLEGYRDPDMRDDATGRLSAEIGDVLVFLTKIAVHYGIDLETVVQNVVAKAEKRWSIDEAHRQMERYMQQQQKSSAQRVASWEERNEGR